MDVDGIGEVDAVAPLDRHPGPGESVRLAVDRTRIAVIGATRRQRFPRLGRVYRRAYVLLVGTAVLMGGLAVAASVTLDKQLADPEGSFLGPSYLRLPLLLLGALLLDMLPRTLWYSRLNPKAMPAIVRNRWRTHWNRERITLVALGIICFYVVYVSYRNLKSFLPFINETMYDRELHLLDRALFFGHEPATVLHGMLGTASRRTCCPTSTWRSCRWCRWA